MRDWQSGQGRLFFFNLAISGIGAGAAITAITYVMQEEEENESELDMGTAVTLEEENAA